MLGPHSVCQAFVCTYGEHFDDLSPKASIPRQLSCRLNGPERAEDWCSEGNEVEVAYIHSSSTNV